MTSRIRVSASSRPSPPLYPHFNRPSGFWPCVKSCLVGGNDKYRFSAFREALYPVDETHSAGRKRWAVQVGCVLSLDVPLASGGRPPGFNPLRRGWVYRPAPEAPLLRGMPTGSEAFLEMPGACGLGPCAWPHPKKSLVLYSSGWWDGGQIPLPFNTDNSIKHHSFVCKKYCYVSI